MSSKEIDTDWWSRLNVSLKTSDGSYDEVVAFSERIINSNFKSLFAVFEDDMKPVVFNDPDFGIVECQIEAPWIVIPGNQDDSFNKDVFYMMKFKKNSWVETLSGYRHSMDDWVLAIPTKLNVEEVLDDKTVYETVVVNKEQKACSVAGTIYKFPGDYSAERLFAQLSTASWAEPDGKLSQIKDEKGTEMKLAEWKTKGLGSKTWPLIATVLADWGMKQHEAGRSTFNVSFKLPAVRYNPQVPTYSPTFLWQQTYPYLNAAKGINVAKTSETGEGFNALLWCEMVASNKAPSTKQLPQRGNFVIPERSYKGGEAIDGTFALSYSHFLEGHLLPRLQRLNQASAVVKLTQVRSFDEKDYMYMTTFSYEIGNFHLTHTDDAFKFRRVETNGDRDDSVITYEWKFSERCPDEMYTWSDRGTLTAKTDHRSTTTVTVSWTIGSNTFNLKGRTEYFYNDEHYQNQNCVPDAKSAQLKYKYEANWALDIVLNNIHNGKVEFKVSEPKLESGQPGFGVAANLTVAQTELYNLRMVVPAEQEEKIRTEFTTVFSRCLGDIEIDLAAQFDGTAGQFIYPGNGDLIFSNPMISRFGNILAEVKHEPAQDLKAGRYITVERPLKLPKILLPGYDPRKQEVSVGTKEPICKLTWTMTPAAAISKKEKVHFTLIGKNDTAEAIGIFYVDIKFTSGASGPQLFTNEIINGTKSPHYKDPTPSPSQLTASPTEKEKPKAPGNRLGGMLSMLPGFGGKAGSTDSHNVAGHIEDDSDHANEAAVLPQPTAPTVLPGEGQVGDSSGKVHDAATTDSSSSDKPAVSKPAVLAALPVEGQITHSISSSATVTLAPLRTRYVNESVDKTRWWSLTTRVDKPLLGFWVAPGESITYEWIMDVGVADTYDIRIRENWRTGAKLESVPVPGVSVDKAIKVVVSPF